MLARVEDRNDTRNVYITIAAFAYAADAEIVSHALPQRLSQHDDDDERERGAVFWDQDLSTSSLRRARAAFEVHEPYLKLGAHLSLLFDCRGQNWRQGGGQMPLSDGEATSASPANFRDFLICSRQAMVAN